MPLPSPYHQLSAPLTCHSIRVALLNANSAKLHFEDITADPVLLYTDLVALTESHITENNKRNHQMKNYTLIIKQPKFGQNHHGVALYVSDALKAKLLNLPVTVAIEVLCVDVHFGQEDHTIVLLYRSPSVPQRELLANIETTLKWLQKIKEGK